MNAYKKINDLDLAASLLDNMQIETDITGSIANKVTLEQIKEYMLEERNVENILLNGNFNIWQRGESFSQGGYTADRWYIGDLGSVDQVLRVDLNNALLPSARNALRLDLSLGVTGRSVEQRLDLLEHKCLSSYDLTLSLSLKSDIPVSNALTLEVELDYGVGGDPIETISMGSVDLNNIWQRHERTLTMPDLTAKTIGNNAKLTLRIADLPDQDIIIDIAQIQLEKGHKASAFAHVGMDTELAQCQHYYEKSYDLNIAPAANTSTGIISYQNNFGQFLQRVPLRFQVSKRAVPTVSIYSEAGTVDKLTTYQGEEDAAALNIGRQGCTVENIGQIAHDLAFHYIADAEIY